MTWEDIHVIITIIWVGISVIAFVCIALMYVFIKDFIKESKREMEKS